MEERKERMNDKESMIVVVNVTCFLASFPSASSSANTSLVIIENLVLENTFASASSPISCT